MGRIKTKDIKKGAWEVFKKLPGKFTDDFEHNKDFLRTNKLVESKMTRNKVAGYLVQLVKQDAKRV